jgi:hypothetical protein
MRFPRTPVMEKTFDLFKTLKIQLLPYNISNEQNWLAYNNIRKQKVDLQAHAAWVTDPFRVSRKNGGGVPDKWAANDPGDLLRRTVKPFIDALVANPSNALDDLIEHYDHFSTRSYMALRMGYPPAVINWIETMTVGTGWFDRAFM